MQKYRYKNRSEQRYVIRLISYVIIDISQHLFQEVSDYILGVDVVKDVYYSNIYHLFHCNERTKNAVFGTRRFRL